MQFEAQDTTEKQEWIVLKGILENEKHYLPQPEESLITVIILKENGRPEQISKKWEVLVQPGGLEFLTEKDFLQQAGIRMEKWVLKKNEW